MLSVSTSEIGTVTPNMLGESDKFCLTAESCERKLEVLK